MSHLRHHAIIVTSYSYEHIATAIEKAREFFSSVSIIICSQVNNFYSFLIPPDGSFEGWKESDWGDHGREQYKAWLKGHPQFDWVEVQYGSEYGDDQLVDSSRKNYISAPY